MSGPRSNHREVIEPKGRKSSTENANSPSIAVSPSPSQQTNRQRGAASARPHRSRALRLPPPLHRRRRCRLLIFVVLLLVQLFLLSLFLIVLLVLVDLRVNVGLFFLGFSVLVEGGLLVFLDILVGVFLVLAFDGVRNRLDRCRCTLPGEAGCSAEARRILLLRFGLGDSGGSGSPWPLICSHCSSEAALRGPASRCSCRRCRPRP